MLSYFSWQGLVIRRGTGCAQAHFSSDMTFEMETRQNDVHLFGDRLFSSASLTTARCLRTQSVIIVLERSRDPSSAECDRRVSSLPFSLHSETLPRKKLNRNRTSDIESLPLAESDSLNSFSPGIELQSLGWDVDKNRMIAYSNPAGGDVLSTSSFLCSRDLGCRRRAIF